MDHFEHRISQSRHEVRREWYEGLFPVHNPVHLWKLTWESESTCDYCRKRCNIRVRVCVHLSSSPLLSDLFRICLFSTWNLLFFIAGLGFNSQITLCLLNCFPAVYGVSAMLINVRVGLGFARGAGDSAGTSTRSGFPGRGPVSAIVFSTQRLSDEDEAWMEQGGTPKETTSIVMTVPSWTIRWNCLHGIVSPSWMTPSLSSDRVGIQIKTDLQRIYL